jgi:hypothetical protein
MRRLLVVFALGLAILVPAAVKAQLPTFQLSQELLDFIAAAPPADDLAVGEGKFAPTEKGESAHFTLSAHGPGGLQPARGNVRIDILGLERRGTVECMAVTSTVASIEGTFNEPVEFVGQTFPDFLINVQDNGEPNGQNPRDLAVVALDSQPARCLSSGAPIAAGPIFQGNIVVKDRP